MLSVGLLSLSGATGSQAPVLPELPRCCPDPYRVHSRAHVNIYPVTEARVIYGKGAE